MTDQMTKRLNTGVLNLENAKTIFRRHRLARRNYLAKMLEILHGAPLGDSAWVSRGVFQYLTWGPRNGVPLGVERESLLRLSYP